MGQRLIVGVVIACYLVVVAVAPGFSDACGVKIDGKVPAEYLGAQPGKAYAVVIGVDRYQKIGSLRYPVADAKAVAQTLRQRGYEVTELYNEQATNRAIESELQRCCRKRWGSRTGS